MPIFEDGIPLSEGVLMCKYCDGDENQKGGEIVEDLGRKILEYRAINNLSQCMIAEQIGVNQSIVAKLEKGDKVSAVSRCKVEMWFREKEGE